METHGYFGRHRFLLDNNMVTLSPPAPPGAANSNNSDFENNMVVILAGLLCALICVLGLNSMVRCAFKCCQLGFQVETPPDQESGPGGQLDSSDSGGIKKEALSQIPVEVYSSAEEMGMGMGIPTMTAAECPICLGEFTDGEKVRILPECKHGFHVKCIDKWLALNSSCPTCRATLS